MQLFKELQRRNVFRVGLAYIVSSWLLIQVADLVLENIGAPDWVMQTIMLLLALGFPVVLFFAWAFEVTPEGIKRESEVDRSVSVTHVTGRRLDRTILAVLVVALGYFIWESRFSDRAHSGAETAPGQSESVAAPAVGPAADTSPRGGPADPRSIAVLPFENRSNLEDDTFFSEGIHDELLTNLARIGSLRVISRTSVMRYQDTLLSIPEIAEELGVATVLEGAVQRAGDTVRINVQLIDAQTDEHLWADIYDRELTAETLFAIQTEISQSIARSLRTTLSPEEQQRISATPTANLAAYDAYLRGRHLERLGDNESMRAALTVFRESTDLDPDFAAAWAARARMVLQLRETGFWGEIPRDEAFLLAQNNIDRALGIDSQSAEAHTVQARMHYEQYRFDEALESLDLALSINPNLSHAYLEKAQLLGSIGEIKAAWSAILEAMDRDPFDRNGKFQAGYLVNSYLGPAYASALVPYLDEDPFLLRMLDLVEQMYSGASAAEIFGALPREVFMFARAVPFLVDHLKEARTANVESALRPDEIRLDVQIYNDGLEEALATYEGLSDERREAAINLERLSIVRMGLGQCGEGLAALDRAHGGEVRLFGQIPPNQNRSNPNLALNRVHCLRQAGRDEEAAILVSDIGEYVETLRRNAEYGYSMLEVKLHILDGQAAEAIDRYENALEARDMTWYNRYDPVIRTLAGDPAFDTLNARIDAAINAERAALGWPPTELIAWDSDAN
jgi:TolB-like protein